MIIRRIEPDDVEAGAVAALVDGAFRYYGGSFWKWKYGDATGPARAIVVADADGELIGCNHYLALTYHLGNDHSAAVAVAGDLVVVPDRRRRRVATRLSIESRRIATEAWPKAAFVVMFTWRELGRHYEKLLGYTRVTPGFRAWSKRLSWTGELGRLATMNEDLVANHPRLAQVDHIVHLDLAGAPPLALRVDRRGFRPADTDRVPSFRVQVRHADRFAGRRRRWLAATAAVARGEVRVSGSPGALLQALSVVGAYRQVARVLKIG